MTLTDQKLRQPVLRGVVSHWWDRKTRREAMAIAPFVDASFYLENNGDVAASGIEPCYHYAKYGWREGRDPSPSFSTRAYLEAHPGVAKRGQNPLLHFAEKSEPMPDGPPQTDNETLDREVAFLQGRVDAKFYSARYPDFRKTGLDPAQHYCVLGWRAGHDPSPDFSTSYYLLTNPDIKAASVNPFWHYLIAGREEGRLPLHPGGWRHATLTRQTTLEAQCTEWTRLDPAPEPMSAASLRAKLDAARTEQQLLISIGHDDYRVTPGGVQLCIEIEELQSRTRGADYLNVHPWQPLPKLADIGSDPLLCLVLNGYTLGYARQSSVSKALRQARATVGQTQIVVHHLAGQTTEGVLALANSVKARSAYLWLHDYFTLCTSYALQRNNVTPCNAPSANSNACRICIFGSERNRQLSRFAALFEALDVHVISPSEAAKQFWLQRTTLKPASLKVHPHVRLRSKTLTAKARINNDAPVRIAFVGTPVAHKGWHVFRDLANRLAHEAGYEFWFFGDKAPELDRLKSVRAHVRASEPDAVSKALAANEIDLVFHWASWRETFSFSTFEALGAGAYVVTNAGSGNVAATIERLGRGLVLDTTEQLFETAAAGGLRRLAKSARQARANSTVSTEFSAMTLDLFEELEPT